MVMADGFRLPLVTWEPTGGTGRDVIRCTPSATFRLAFAEAGPALARRGFLVHAYDQRGFGDTDGRGRWHGWRRLVRDLRAVIDMLAAGRRLAHVPAGREHGRRRGPGRDRAVPIRSAVDGLILVEPAVRRGVRLRLMWDVAFGTLALLAPGYSRRLTRGTHAQFTPIARERLRPGSARGPVHPRRRLQGPAVAGRCRLRQHTAAARADPVPLRPRRRDHSAAPVRARGARSAPAGDGPSLS